MDGWDDYYGVNVTKLTADELSFEETATISIFLIASGILLGILHLISLAVFVRFPSDYWSSETIAEVFLLLVDLGCAILQIFSGVAAWKRQWIWGSPGCQAYAFSGFLFGTAQILSVPLIAYARARQLNVKVDRSCHVKEILLLTATVIILATFFATAPLFGLGRYNILPTKIVCLLDWMHVDLLFLIYVSVYAGVVILLGLLIATICYIRITVATCKGTDVDWAPKGHAGKLAFGSLLGTYIPFSVCGVCVLWALLDAPGNIPLRLQAVPPVLVKLAGFFHFLFYRLLNPKFRAALKRMCGCNYDPTALLVASNGPKGTDEERVRLRPHIEGPPVQYESEKLPPVDEHGE